MLQQTLQHDFAGTCLWCSSIYLHVYLFEFLSYTLLLLHVWSAVFNCKCPGFRSINQFFYLVQHYDLESENLQSRALDLNCRCRALRSHILTRGRSDTSGTEAFRQGPSISLLKLACDVLDSSKLLVMWLDRFAALFVYHCYQMNWSNITNLDFKIAFKWLLGSRHRLWNIDWKCMRYIYLFYH